MPGRSWVFWELKLSAKACRKRAWFKHRLQNPSHKYFLKENNPQFGCSMVVYVCREVYVCIQWKCYFGGILQALLLVFLGGYLWDRTILNQHVCELDDPFPFADNWYLGWGETAVDAQLYTYIVNPMGYHLYVWKPFLVNISCFPSNAWDLSSNNS